MKDQVGIKTGESWGRTMGKIEKIDKHINTTE
jgi:hypothetical protein